MNFNLLPALVTILFFAGHAFGQLPGNHKIQTPSGNVRGMVIDPEGETIFLTDNETILRYSLKSEKFVGAPMQAHHDAIQSLVITPDGQWLVSAARDSVIIIWDIQTGEVLQRLSHHRAQLHSVSISANKSTVVSAGTDNTIVVHNIEFQKTIHVIRPETQSIAVAISPDGALMAIGGARKDIMIYSLETGQLTQELVGHTNWVRGFGFHDAGRQMISWGDDSQILIWEINDDRKISRRRQIEVNQGWITAVAMKSDSDNTLSVGTINGKVKIDIGINSYSEKLGVPVTQIAFLPAEGQQIRIAVATRGKGVIILEARTMKVGN